MCPLNAFPALFCTHIQCFWKLSSGYWILSSLKVRCFSSYLGHYTAQVKGRSQRLKLKWIAGQRLTFTHTHTDVPGFGTASIPATYLFGGPYSALKTKNTYFSYGFEGALVSWCGGGLGVCRGIEGFLLILAPACLFWCIWTLTWKIPHAQPPYLGHARWNEATQGLLWVMCMPESVN